MATKIYEKLIGRTLVDCFLYKQSDSNDWPRHEILTQLANNELNSADGILFVFSDGQSWRMFHERECCEDVYIEDIAGDISLLTGLVTVFEEFTEEGERDDDYNTSTYTFYRLTAGKESVSVRWYGTSNGYYSEEAEVAPLPETARVIRVV